MRGKDGDFPPNISAHIKFGDFLLFIYKKFVHPLTIFAIPVDNYNKSII
ncbi:MAG: hypothetical protein HPY66_0970 [Firmicutes bacterium]|nr:hypothetical protein [Bacillota bacterium]